MRSLSTLTQASIDQNLGVEPITIIQIDWDSGTVYYSEKAFSLDTITTVAQLLEFNRLQNLRKTDTMAEASGASIVLDDTDGALKIILNTEVIEGKAVTAYQHFQGITQVNDLTVIFKGKIAGGIDWSEGDRTLSISIDTSVEDREVGYAPSEGDIVDINPNAVDKPWPLCFGTVVHVPAVRLKYGLIGSLASGINESYEVFDVQGAELYPQSPTVVQIYVDTILFQGTFKGRTFTVTNQNMPHHTNIAFVDRYTTDPHVDDASVAWIATDDNVVGLYCYADTRNGFAINKCIRQEGKKCFFIEPWGVHVGDLVQYVILGSGDTLLETAGIPRYSWGFDFIMEPTARSRPTEFSNEIVYGYDDNIAIARGSWGIMSGAKVRLKVAYKDLYICNLVASTEILSVYGKRTFKNQEIFVPIPSSYYTKHWGYPIAGYNVTAIEFSSPLEDRVGENWDGNIYVSLRSSRGTNVASIIRWLIETYSNLTVDATFDAVAAKVGAYPANFVIFDQPNVLGLVEDIAWQARCALVIRNTVASIIYLSKLTIGAMTLDESNIELKSLALGFSDTDDIITKLTGQWLRDYSGYKNASRRVIYKNNITVFNLIEDDRNFYIYNDANLVKLSTYFWGYRYSNSWRRISFKAFLDALAIEPFDTINHDIPIVSTNALRGTVEETSHDSYGQSIALNSELASKAGDSVSGQPVEDLNYWLGDPAFPVDPWNNPIIVMDPGAGLEESDYVVAGDADTEPPPPESQYFLTITDYPSLVERGIAFGLNIEIRDVQGSLVNESVVATITLSTSGIDTIAPTSIPLVGGTFSGNATISGDVGQQTGVITVSAAGYQPDATGVIDIVPVRSNLVFVGPIPTPIVRETGQGVLKVLQGGSPGDIIDIALNAPTQDKLYTSGDVEITTLTADALGDFFLPANWQIKDGQGNTTAQITFKDTAQKIYNDVTSNTFQITGATTLTINHSLAFTQTEIGNPKSLAIVIGDFIPTEYPFELEVQVLDSGGTIDTTFNGTVTVNILDNLKDVLPGLYWIFAGYDAIVLSEQIIVTITNGVWSFDSCVVKIPDGTTDLYLTAQGDVGLYDEILMEVRQPFYTIALNTSVIERGTSYNMTVSARNPDGTIDATYEPINDPTITLSNGDPSDIISPSVMGLTGWVDGVKTISFSISGGTGIDPTDLTVQETTRVGRTELAVVATAGYTTTSVAPIAKVGYLGSGYLLDATKDDCSPEGKQGYINQQAIALAALRADITLSGTLTRTGFSYTIYPPVINQNAWLTADRTEFSVSNAEKAVAEAAYLVFNIPGSIEELTPPGGWTFFEFAYKYGLKLDYDYVGNKYTSGAAAYGANMPMAWNFVELNDKITAVGGVPSIAGTAITIPIPISWITNMPANTIYIWLSITIPILSKKTDWCDKKQEIHSEVRLDQLKWIKP